MAVGLLALPGPRPAAGQGPPLIPGRDPAAPLSADDWVAPRWLGDVSFAATNALLAGVTAGVSRWIQGGDFRDAFAAGAAGGAVAYAGRRVAVEPFEGAGLLGRQISALGVSVVRNAGDGVPVLDRLFFPVGPVHLYVDRAGQGRAGEDRARGWRVRPKLHVVGTAQAVRLALTDEAHFDWGASLSAGAPVFRAPGHRLSIEGVHARGLGINGVIVLGESHDSDPERLFAHERVHILQGDLAFLTWSDPVEDWLMDRHRLTAAVYRFLDFGVVLPAMAIGGMRAASLDFTGGPHELEAAFLAER